MSERALKRAEERGDVRPYEGLKRGGMKHEEIECKVA